MRNEVCEMGDQNQRVLKAKIARRELLMARHLARRPTSPAAADLAAAVWLENGERVGDEPAAGPAPGHGRFERRSRVPDSQSHETPPRRLPLHASGVLWESGEPIAGGLIMSQGNHLRRGASSGSRRAWRRPWDWPASARAEDPAPDLTAEERTKLEAQAKECGERTNRYYREGRLTNALEEAEQRRKIERRLYPPAKYPEGHHDLAAALNNLGMVFQAMGRYEPPPWTTTRPRWRWTDGSTPSRSIPTVTAGWPST